MYTYIALHLYALRHTHTLTRTAPHRTAPHRTAPHRTAPHRTAPHRTAPHRTAPHRTAPHRTAPHRTAPHRTAPHRAHTDIHTVTLLHYAANIVSTSTLIYLVYMCVVQYIIYTRLLKCMLCINGIHKTCIVIHNILSICKRTIYGSRLRLSVSPRQPDLPADMRICNLLSVGQFGCLQPEHPENHREEFSCLRDTCIVLKFNMENVREYVCEYIVLQHFVAFITTHCALL